MRSKDRIKKFLLRFLTLLLVFNIISVSISRVAKAEPTTSGNNTSDANSRIKTFINFFKEQDKASMSDLNSLTAEDFRIMGIFLSNFYVSWGTKINSEFADDNEVFKEMTSTLVNQCGFKDTVAKSLIRKCVSASYSTAKPLYLHEYDYTGYTGEGKIGNAVSDDPCTYDKFLEYMRKNKSGTIGYCLAWHDDSGSPILAFKGSYKKDDKLRPSNSVLAYGMVAGSLDYTSGYGSSVLGVTADGKDNKAIDKAMEQYTDKDDPESVTVLKSALYVDCFGNILCDYGLKNEQYVILPACNNPMVWTGREGNSEAGKPGTRLPMVNTISLANTVCGNGDNLKIKGTKNDNKLEGYNIKISGDLFTYKPDDNIYIGAGYTTYDCPTIKYWRVVRGVKSDDTGENDSNIDLKRGGWIFGGDNNLVEALKNKLEPTNNPPGQIGSEKGATTSGLCDYVGVDSVNALIFPSWYVLSSDNGYKISENKKGFSYTASREKVIDDFIYIDDIGKLTENSDFKTLTTVSSGILSSDLKSLNSSNAFGKSNSENLDGTSNIRSGYGSSAKNYLAGIYLSYLLASINNDAVSYTLNDKLLPEVGDNFENIFSNADIAEQASNERASVITTMIYYLLHPVEGVNYIMKLVKKFTVSILTSVHTTIIGTGNQSNVATTRYLGFSGYVTTPELTDMEWTAKLVSYFDNIYYYVTLIIVVILLCQALLRVITIQRAIGNAILFIFCASLPMPMINFAIQTTNRVSDSLYSKKFMYWGLIQHQAYAQEISNAAKAEGEGDYDAKLTSIFTARSLANNENAIAVRLKWQCPKKNNYMVTTEEAIEDTANPSTGQSALLKNLLSAQLSGQDFVSNDEATYLYRSYADISNYSKYIYRNIKNSNTSLTLNADVLNTLDLSLSNYKDDLEQAYKDGFNVLGKEGKLTDSAEAMPNSNIRFESMFYTGDLKKYIKDKDLSALKLGEYVGIPVADLQYDIAKINNNGDSIMPNAGLISFVQNTESPYYYFSWNFYDQGFSTDDGATGTFKDLMLGNKTGGTDSYFCNTKIDSIAKGDMKDYLDMRSLFTVVIPTLKKANDIVLQWDNLYGLNIYEDISSNIDDADEYKDANDEIKYKFWHNVNVAQLWNMYSPWVDLMYSCNYAKPKKVQVMGDDYVIQDPLNPASYWKDVDGDGTWSSGDLGRPMIFSESEKNFYGLKDKDLTEVEKKIIQTNSDTMKDLYRLMNYYTFDDGVLNTASAMTATFNFNKVFSQTNLIGTGYTLYPQSFELKNFSYDAYIRLIMANATGESLLGNENIYLTILQNSNIFTGIFLIVNDALSMFVVSGLKLIFLLVILVISIFMLISTAINPEIKLMDTMTKSLITPLAKFLLISVSHAFVISMLMSDGSVNITQYSTNSISLGDPTMTLILLCVINCVVTFAYYKVVKQSGVDMFKIVKSAGTMALGAVTGAVGLGMSALKSGMSHVAGAVNGVASVVGFARNTYDRGLERKANRATINGGSSSGGEGTTPNKEKKKKDSDLAQELAQQGMDKNDKPKDKGGENTNKKKKGNTYNDCTFTNIKIRMENGKDNIDRANKAKQNASKRSKGNKVDTEEFKVD